MIFYLNCAEAELAASGSAELEDLFSRAVSADRFGRHFFITRREICSWAIDNLGLSSLDAAHLKLIQEDYAGRRALLENTRAYVEITIGEDSVTFDNSGYFAIGHRLLLEGEYLSVSTSFVMEDSHSDASLYEHILRETQKVLRGPSYKYENVHGGGSSTARVFDEEIQKLRVVVCIVDHDQLAPMDRKSSVANSVLTNCRRRNINKKLKDPCFIGLGLTTVGREAENFIPYHLLKRIPRFSDYGTFGELDGIVRQDESAQEHECFWQFFDVKEGLSGTKLKQMLDRGDISDETFRWICDIVDCREDQVEDVCIEGFGEGVIEAFLETPEVLSEFHGFVRTQYWKHMFSDCFENLLWYFAAPRRIRT